ncbi:uncharacterized protein EV422DRAFT_522952 [Fimicolochytrium jonesii]|uniref:uncharacterized protein n=1 Tax=Fimicolochytrium jonesii TaxID=1396493 RepID=UPI0022FE8C83|nr:uncharacterized protein EV422DRAFT_522952 [Fimicolochytrium jonesii]KAI8822983.1 hypothetical protein EV422DRAFT_522952 [Fimicolochytrium jonesii]
MTGVDLSSCGGFRRQSAGPFEVHSAPEGTLSHDFDVNTPSFARNGGVHSHAMLPIYHDSRRRSSVFSNADLLAFNDLHVFHSKRGESTRRSSLQSQHGEADDTHHSPFMVPSYIPTARNVVMSSPTAPQRREMLLRSPPLPAIVQSYHFPPMPPRARESQPWKHMSGHWQRAGYCSSPHASGIDPTVLLVPTFKPQPMLPSSPRSMSSSPLGKQYCKDEGTVGPAEHDGSEESHFMLDEGSVCSSDDEFDRRLAILLSSPPPQSPFSESRTPQREEAEIQDDQPGDLQSDYARDMKVPLPLHSDDAFTSRMKEPIECGQDHPAHQARLSESDLVIPIANQEDVSAGSDVSEEDCGTTDDCDSDMSTYCGRLPFDRICTNVVQSLETSANECTILVTQPSAVQKSYGDEKRFFVSPICRLTGTGWHLDGLTHEDVEIRISTVHPTFCRKTGHLGGFQDKDHSAKTKRTGQGDDDDMGRLASSAGLKGVLERSVQKLDRLSRTPTSTNGRGKYVVVGVFNKVHIADSESRKAVPLYYQVKTPTGQFLYHARPITKISKPSKKKLTHGSQLLITSGSTLTLFNREKSQTGISRFLGVDIDTCLPRPCPATSQFFVWDNWVIFRADDPRMLGRYSPPVDVHRYGRLGTEESGELLWNPKRARDNLSPSAQTPRADLNTTGLSPLIVHYGDKIVLQHCATGAMLRPMCIRKLENRTRAIIETSEYLGGNKASCAEPVAPLHKVAFQIYEHTGQYLSVQRDEDDEASVQIQCTSLSRATDGPSSAKTGTRRKQRHNDDTEEDDDDERGATVEQRKRRRCAGRATKVTNRGKPSVPKMKGGKMIDDVGDACVWTLVATEHTETTFVLPKLTREDRKLLSLPLSDPGHQHPLLSAISPVPTIYDTCMSPDTTKLFLFGENFDQNIWVFLGREPAKHLKIESDALLVCWFPSKLKKRTGRTDTQPILIARDDGVVFRTGRCAQL